MSPNEEASLDTWGTLDPKEQKAIISDIDFASRSGNPRKKLGLHQGKKLSVNSHTISKKIMMFSSRCNLSNYVDQK